MAAASAVSGSSFSSAEDSSASFLRAARRRASLLRARLGVTFRGAGGLTELGDGGVCCVETC